MNLRITEIGEVTGEKNIEIFDRDGNILNYEYRGYIHLG